MIRNNIKIRHYMDPVNASSKGGSEFQETASPRTKWPFTGKETVIGALKIISTALGFFLALYINRYIEERTEKETYETTKTMIRKEAEFNRITARESFVYYAITGGFILTELNTSISEDKIKDKAFLSFADPKLIFAIQSYDKYARLLNAYRDKLNKLRDVEFEYTRKKEEPDYAVTGLDDELIYKIRFTDELMDDYADQIESFAPYAAKEDSLDPDAEALDINLDRYKKWNQRILNTARAVPEGKEAFSIKGLNDHERTSIEDSLYALQNYLIQLGYKPREQTIPIYFQSTLPVKNSTICTYEDEKIIYISKSYSKDIPLILKQYLMIVLNSEVYTGDHSPIGTNDWYYTIKYGLIKYFLCSRNNSPIIMDTIAKEEGVCNADISISSNFYPPRNYDEVVGRVANTWANTFWEIRKDAGDTVIDKLLFKAWGVSTRSGGSTYEPKDFTNVILRETRGKRCSAELRKLIATKGF